MALIAGVVALGMSAATAASAGAANSLTPSSWNFGTSAIGTTTTAKSFTLTVPCTLSAGGEFCEFYNYLTPVISTSGDYAVAGTDCPPTMMAGPPPASPSQSCTISVTFGPTAAGTRTGTLQTGGPSASLTGFAPAPVTTGTGPVPGSAPVNPTKKCKKHRSASVAKKRCKRKRRAL